MSRKKYLSPTACARSMGASESALPYDKCETYLDVLPVELRAENADRSSRLKISRRESALFSWGVSLGENSFISWKQVSAPASFFYNTSCSRPKLSALSADGKYTKRHFQPIPWKQRREMADLDVMVLEWGAVVGDSFVHLLADWATRSATGRYYLVSWSIASGDFQGKVPLLTAAFERSFELCAFGPEWFLLSSAAASLQLWSCGPPARLLQELPEKTDVALRAVFPLVCIASHLTSTVVCFHFDGKLLVETHRFAPPSNMWNIYLANNLLTTPVSASPVLIICGNDVRKLELSTNASQLLVQSVRSVATNGIVLAASVGEEHRVVLVDLESGRLRLPPQPITGEVRVLTENGILAVDPGMHSRGGIELYTDRGVPLVPVKMKRLVHATRSLLLGLKTDFIAGGENLTVYRLDIPSSWPRKLRRTNF